MPLVESTYYNSFLSTIDKTPYETLFCWSSIRLYFKKKKERDCLKPEMIGQDNGGHKKGYKSEKRSLSVGKKVCR